MPILTATLGSGSTGSTVKTLHSELLVIGFDVNETEASSSSFGATTQNAVIEFQQKYHIEPTGKVDPATGALMTATAKFAVDGNTPELRDSLADAVNNIPENPVLAHWLARYQILAGNYDKGREALATLDSIDGSESFRQPLAGILEEPANIVVQPEIPHPGNFYTYQYSVLETSTVDRLLNGIVQHPDSFPGTGGGGSSEFVLFLKKGNEDGPADPPGVPDHPPGTEPEEPEPEEPSGPDPAKQNAGSAGYQALSAFQSWYLGNQDMARGLFARAEKHYSACRDAAVRYFLYQYRDTIRHSPRRDMQLTLLLTDLHKFRDQRAPFWDKFTNRNITLSLKELHRLTWIEPYEIIKKHKPPYDGSVDEFLKLLKLSNNKPSASLQKAIEVPLVTLIYVLIPLAQAEALRQRGHFKDALRAVDRVVKPLRIEASVSQGPGPIDDVILFARRFPFDPTTIEAPFKLRSDFIEKPFALMLKAQILLDQADNEYKARRLDEATESYQQVVDLFEDNNAYKSGIEEAATKLKEDVSSLLKHSFHPLAIDDTASPPITVEQRREYELLGKQIAIPEIEAETETLPGLDKRMAPQQPMLKFTATDGTTNPLIFALIAEAISRLLQIDNGFNYLGYSDEYVPPWRFQFLLDRARYFADHAKNAQREYLNFLSNAEREELQEITASQAVELEKSNVRIETARVEQVRLETEVAKLGLELGVLTANNAQIRLDNFAQFDRYADKIMDTAGGTFIAGSSLDIPILGDLPGLRTVGGAVGDFFSGGAVSKARQAAVDGQRRELEKKNLDLTVLEAQKSSEIAGTQLQAAQAGLVVAGMQRSAALLRHEFAMQSLNFLRNRTLNSETWYRLAAMIRSVADTYMRYAVELAFLAEQAYEFEADKRINVIRFDYDSSEEGRLLAADFLKQDLDTLEQDLIVTQRQREQQVKYVSSLSRDFPEALQALRENRSTIFTLRLEQLERRFPGVFNIRIGSLEVLPIALMDPLQFSLQLSYLGSSQVRLKAHPDTVAGEPSPSPLNTNDLDLQDGWLAEIGEQWPVKIRVTGPETAVYSGLSQAEAQSAFPFISSGQRGAFESLGAAAAWHIDMGMKENKVVPGSLADVLITFNVSGYFDPQLRSAVDAASRSDTVLTSWLSAKQRFPDQFFDFNQTGKLSWEVSQQMLSFDRPVGALRNIGFQLLPAPSRHNFSQIQSRYVVQFEVDQAGNLELLSEIPDITILSDQLTLNTQAELDPGAEIIWDFGDESELQQGATQSHTYQRPGMYDVKLRVTKNNRLSEFHASVAISQLHDVVPPNTAFPKLSAESGPDNLIRINASTEGTNGLANTSFWKLGQNRMVRGNSASFDVKPGTYVVAFTAIRELKARIYSHQHFDTQQSFALDGLRVTSNREFELDGTETTSTPNELTNHIFSGVPISPVDKWTVELRLEDNTFLRGIGQNDVGKFELGAIADAALIMEYEILAG